ncbi:MAG: hypothetical protein ACKVZJ_12240 [Phycisphaerales bacterium]
MKQTVIRWSIVAGAALVVGPIAGRLTGMLRAPDGGPDATAFLTSTPILGVVVTLAAILLAWAYALFATKFLNFKWGMLCAGLIVAWAAWNAGRADAVIRRVQSPSALWALAIEGLVWGLVGVVASFFITRASDRRAAGVDADAGTRTDSVKAAGVGILVAGLAATAVARSEMVGQTFLAAVTAGAVGTLVGRIVGHRACVPASMLACPALAFLGPAAAAIFHGSGVLDVLYKGDLFALARIMPLDWLGGMLIGTAVGVSWAGGMVEKHAPTTELPASI